MDNSKAKGLLFLVSAPSGAGKSSLVHDLITKDPKVHLSISYTTREVRPGEQNGVDYHFISQEDFEERKKNHEFLEWAFVHGNYYGTSRLWIEQELAAGYDVMLEIDWQGALQVKKIFPEVISTFILPPSIEALKQRLVGRGTDAPEVIARRLKGAGAEIVHAPQFDYVIINNDFNQASCELQSIIRATRLRYECQARREQALFASLGVPA